MKKNPKRSLKVKKRTLFLSVLLVLLLPFLAFGSGKTETETVPVQTEETVRAKYVFLFIGDGMAIPQINAAEAYLAAGETAPGVRQLSFTRFPAGGLTTTYAADAYITDSASAGTAIACGYKTDSGVISMDSSRTQSFPTIAEMAKAAGMKVGIVSSVNLDHATPAVFYAHNASRNNYYELNMTMANSDFDYFAGGMVRTSKTPKGEKSAHDVMAERGFTMVSDRASLEALKPGAGQVYAYNTGFAAEALDYVMDMDENDITLAEFTRKGIELLENDRGFFMMVEGGKIDWACHANDAAASIHNTIAFDKAVQEAEAFARKHPGETLIIVTGDHETGGLALGFAGTQYESAFSEISKQKMSFEAFDAFVLKPYREAHPEGGSFQDMIPVMEETFGLTGLSDLETRQLKEAFRQSMMNRQERASDDQAFLLYGGYEPFSVTLTHILNQRAGLAWTSYAHTGVPVQTFALGAGQEQFNGYYDNTDIFRKMKTLMGL